MISPVLRPILAEFTYTLKEDEIIGYKDLEENVAHAKTLGYSVDPEMFEGSFHVGHMRLHPDQYWNTISNSWKQAMAEK